MFQEEELCCENDRYSNDYDRFWWRVRVWRIEGRNRKSVVGKNPPGSRRWRPTLIKAIPLKTAGTTYLLTTSIGLAWSARLRFAAREWSAMGSVSNCSAWMVKFKAAGTLRATGSEPRKADYSRCGCAERRKIFQDIPLRFSCSAVMSIICPAVFWLRHHVTVQKFRSEDHVMNVKGNGDWGLTLSVIRGRHLVA